MSAGHWNKNLQRTLFDSLPLYTTLQTTSDIHYHLLIETDLITVYQLSHQTNDESICKLLTLDK